MDVLVRRQRLDRVDDRAVCGIEPPYDLLLSARLPGLGFAAVLSVDVGQSLGTSTLKPDLQLRSDLLDPVRDVAEHPFVRPT